MFADSRAVKQKENLDDFPMKKRILFILYFFLDISSLIFLEVVVSLNNRFLFYFVLLVCFLRQQ